MCYVLFQVHAYTFLLTSTTFLFSLLGGLCIHCLGDMGNSLGTTVHSENSAAHFRYCRIARSRAVSRVWVKGSLGCSFAGPGALLFHGHKLHVRWVALRSPTSRFHISRNHHI